ncbi:hypothetical protein Droror1_Dr00020166 [Drosera rotundifolia]
MYPVEECGNSNYTLRSRYYLLPCYLLFNRSIKLLMLVLNKLEVFATQLDATPLSHPAQLDSHHWRRITMVVAVFLMISKDDKLRYVLSSCRDEMYHLMQSVLSIQDYKKYVKGCKFLPQVNNEIEATRNSTYKERFESLEKLVLIMFENDTILVPKETSWFGYYENSNADTLLPANETELYTEDWIGLKTLDEAGKVEYFKVPGGHLAITESKWRNTLCHIWETPLWISRLTNLYQDAGGGHNYGTG